MLLQKLATEKRIKLLSIHVRVQYLTGLGTRLFFKAPRPGDSIGTFLVFESNCHLLLPVLAT